MDPATIAMILKAAGEAAPGIGAGISKIDFLSAEQKNKMKELERQQALGLLGLDKAQEQQILSQQLQPVQTAGRQLLRETQQAQSIGDVGQGAAFRQQAAQQGALQDATIRATQAAQDQISEMDRLARAEQLAELRGYKQQRQQNIQGATDIVSSLLGGAGDVSAAIDVGKQRQIYEDSLRGETKDAQRRALEKIGPPKDKAFGDELIEVMTSQFKNTPNTQMIPPIPSFTDSGFGTIIAPPGPTPGVFVDPSSAQFVPSREMLESINTGFRAVQSPTPPIVHPPKKVSWGTLTPILDPAGNIIQFSYVSRTGKTGILDAFARGSNGLTAMDEYMGGQ